MTFHVDFDKFMICYLCKLINPKITTYIKLDMDEPTALSNYKILNNFNWKKKIKLYLAKSIDLFTVETKSVYKIINQYPMFENKLFYLPNGFYAEKPYDFSTKKEKMIITVGRIGAPQKHNELLLDAIELLENLRDYKFYFIGPMEKKFQVKLDELIFRRRDLKDKIILTGNITDQRELFEYYKKAELLCFTSLYESFGLVLTEGLFFGCYLLSTDLGALYDIVEIPENRKIIDINSILFLELQNNGVTDLISYINKNYEKILTSDWHKKAVYKLSSSLREAIEGNVFEANYSRKCSNYIYCNLNWLLIADKLCTHLNSCKK